MRNSSGCNILRIGRSYARAMAGACLLMAGLTADAAETGVTGTVPEFKIGAYRLPKKLRTETVFREMKEAGIDFIIDEFHNDKPSLDMMQRLGIGAVSSRVIPSEWGGHTNVNGRLEELLPIQKFEKVAASLKPHPAEMMFSAGDENSALDFPHLAKAFRRVREINPDIKLYFNIHPSGIGRKRKLLYYGVDSYQRYIEEYFRHIPLDYTCFDMYVYCRPRAWRLAVLFESYRTVADACRDNNRHFWFVGQVNTHKPSVEITEQKLRFQAYSAMAFGVERFIWACWAPGWWTNNVLTAEGEKTAQYGRVKTVNMELRRLAPQYMQFVRRETFFSGFTGDAAIWLTSEKPQYSHVPPINVNQPGAISTALFTGVKADDGQPLILGDMTARDGGARRALFVFAADDPYDEKPLTRTVHFRSTASVSAIGPNGPVELSRAADGTYSFAIGSSMCVMLIGVP